MPEKTDKRPAYDEISRAIFVKKHALEKTAGYAGLTKEQKDIFIPHATNVLNAAQDYYERKIDQKEFYKTLKDNPKYNITEKAFTQERFGRAIGSVAIAAKESACGNSMYSVLGQVELAVSGKPFLNPDKIKEEKMREKMIEKMKEKMNEFKALNNKESSEHSRASSPDGLSDKDDSSSPPTPTR